jgi:hypothetical protein
VSVWINGYVSPSSIDAVAEGKGINVTQYRNVSVMNFGNSTTLCSWYSGGWTKTLVSILGKNCTAYITNTTNTLNNSNLYFALRNRNDSLLNFSGYAPNLTYAGDIFANGNALVFESLMKGVYFDNTCYGNILNLSNHSYCLQALFQGNVLLNQMNRLAGRYNISVWWIPSANATQSSENYALNLSGSYDLAGNGITFVSAYANRCIFSQLITCQNPVFASNLTKLRIGLSIVNGYNGAIRLNGIGCTLMGNFTMSRLDVGVPAGKNATVYMPCYNYGTEINSSIIPSGATLQIELNYSRNNITNTTYGFAEIIK